MDIPVLSLIVSALAFAVAAWSLKIASEKHEWEKKDRVKKEEEKHPVYSHEITQGKFDGRYLPFTFIFRQISGDPCYIESSRIHFWFYKYLEDGTQDEVWNSWFDLFERKWVKTEDQPTKHEHNLDLAHMIAPTHVKVRAYEYYQKEGSWRVSYDLLDISIKEFTQEIYKNDTIYESMHS